MLCSTILTLIQKSCLALHVGDQLPGEIVLLIYKSGDLYIRNA